MAKPTLFIPSPNVAEDHQTKNALSIVNQNGAKMLKEEELDELFQKRITQLLESEAMQIKLTHAIKKLALPNATKEIVDEIEKLIVNEKVEA